MTSFSPDLRRLLSLCVLGLILAATPPWAVPLWGQQRTGPFTQPPRSLRSRAIDQQHVRLELAFDFDKQQVRGRAIHDLVLFRPASRIDLDAAEMKIERVVEHAEAAEDADGRRDSRELKFSQRGQSLEIELGRELPAESEVRLDVHYTISRPRHGAHFVEPDEDEPTQPRMVWTQSEPEYARYWYPCFDHPSDRLTSEIVATVPSEYITLSNGTLESRTDRGDGTTTWHWHQKKPHVPYLLSIVAGDFEVLQQQWGDLPVQSYVPRGRLADAPRSFEKTPAMVDLYSRQLGVAYPWEKYAQICVDEYGWGGMEHTSATTLNLNTLHDERAHLDVSSENLVAHELIHQWFGNLLTCKDWGELWLNESFATYFATLWTEHDRGWDEAAWQRRGEADSYMREDARYRRPIVSYRYNAPMNMFDRHSYPKGGRVLHMLRFELGDEMFWKAIRRYVEVNQQRSVETADLRIAIEEATGQGMNWFFDQWCYRGGHPEFHVAWDWDSAAGQARVTVKQTQRVDDTTPLFRTSAEIEIATPAGVQMRRVTLSKAEETLHFDAAERPTRVVFDPRDWILKKLTFPKSKEELLDQLAHDEHMPARLQAVEGLAERVADADVISALATALQSDPFFGVRQEAAKALGKANGNAARTALSEAAARDAKSFVRREALAALANHADDEARAAARASIAKDDSYYAVAEALKCLVKIDRDGCRDDLLAALAQPSHDEVILRAACDGLVELKDSAAADAVAQLLGEGASPQRRGILIATLARLRPDDDAVLDRLHALLDNARPHVRRAAIEAVGQIGTADSLDKLLARREREELPGLINTLDEALDKVRGRMQQPEALRKEVEQLRQQNQRLEERLRKLEGERS